MNASSTANPPADLPPADEPARETLKPGDGPKNGATDKMVGPTSDDGADRKAALDAFFGAHRRIVAERRQAALAGKFALERLCDAMRQRTDQGHTLRALLYSLYNGQPASLLELVTLDWGLRKDVCAVALAFGFEEPREPGSAFFYDALKAALTRANLWTWFLEAGESEVAK